MLVLVPVGDEGRDSGNNSSAVAELKQLTNISSVLSTRRRYSSLSRVVLYVTLKWSSQKTSIKYVPTLIVLKTYIKMRIAISARPSLFVRPETSVVLVFNRFQISQLRMLYASEKRTAIHEDL